MDAMSIVKRLARLDPLEHLPYKEYSELINDAKEILNNQSKAFNFSIDGDKAYGGN